MSEQRQPVSTGDGEEYISGIATLALAIAVMLLSALPVLAEGRISLPLEGYYRTGRCMPVLIAGNEAGLLLESAASVPARVSPGRNGVVPMLMLDPFSDVLDNLPLRPLSPEQRLVGWTGAADARLAATLFPAQTIVSVALDQADPILGPAAAWESLDAIVTDGSPPTDFGELLAAGTAVAVRSSDRPDSVWPWRRVEAYWVLEHAPAGPQSAIGGEVAYLPARSWQPERPATLRRQVVLAGVLVALLAMSTLLIRPKWFIVAMVAATVIGGGVVELWRRAQPAIRQAGGQIVVVDRDLVQVDQWQYVAAPNGTAGSRPMRGLDQPVLLDSAHARRAALELRCRADGSQTWQYALAPDSQLAFLSRRISAELPRPAVESADRSPLRELARQAYLGPGMRIAGELPAPGVGGQQEAWPGVVIQAK